MVRKFLRAGCLVECKIAPPNGEENPPGTGVGSIIHTVRVEDTFMTNTDFRALMGLELSQVLRQAHAGVTSYNHRVTANACAINAMRRFSFIIEATDSAVVSPRFGASSKIVQPANPKRDSSFLNANSSTIVFSLDGANYKISEESFKLVGGRQYT